MRVEVKNHNKQEARTRRENNAFDVTLFPSRFAYPAEDTVSVLFRGFWDICEIPMLLAKGLRELGVMAWSVRSGYDNTYLRLRQEIPLMDARDAVFMESIMPYFSVVHLTEQPHPDFLRGLIAGRHKVVIHYHGVGLRENWRQLAERDSAAGYGRIVATPDLLQYQDDDSLYWLPQPVDIEYLDKAYPWRARQKTNIVRIAHAATVRENKMTDHIIATANLLKIKGFDIELDIIERTPHWQSLWRIAQADIYVADMKYGLGMASWEAMVFQVPVVCFADDFTMNVMRERWGTVDFFWRLQQHTELYDTLVELIKNEDLRKKLGRKGRQHVLKHHKPRKIAEELLQYYSQLPHVQHIVPGGI